jgi:hypothetical protein
MPTFLLESMRMRSVGLLFKAGENVNATSRPAVVEKSAFSFTPDIKAPTALLSGDKDNAAA